MFPAWDGYLREKMDHKDCRYPRDQYYFNLSNTDDQALLFNLTNCILNEMDEFRKVEMGITGVVLGLLPTMLQLIGPSSGEVAVLATRRPLLALLLGLAMPSVSMTGPMDDPVAALQRPFEGVRSRGLISGGRMWVVVSVLEYVLAAAAVGNVFHQVYQLAYWSISVSAIAIDSGSISKSYPLFLWLMLLIPVHALGFWNVRLRYHEPAYENKASWGLVVTEELMPCARGRRELDLRHRPKVHPFAAVVKYVADVSSVVVFVFGTVALSSQIFISLGDVVPVIARFMMGTLVCRAVLSFEIHGLWEVKHPPVEDRESVGSEYEMIPGAGSRLAHVVRSSK